MNSEILSKLSRNAALQLCLAGPQDRWHVPARTQWSHVVFGTAVRFSTSRVCVRPRHSPWHGV